MSAPKKDPKWQTHVYLSEADFLLLKAVSEKESRSTTMQIQHFIREGLAKHRADDATLPRAELGTGSGK